MKGRAKLFLLTVADAILFGILAVAAIALAVFMALGPAGCGIVLATETAIPVSKLDERLDKIIAVATAVVVFLGTITHLLLVARARLKALIGAVKGTEAALEPLKRSHPTVYRATKDRLKAILDEEGANQIIAPIVEKLIHAGKDAKPHTQVEIKVPTEKDIKED